MEVIPHCNCLIYSKCGNNSFPLKYIRSTIRTWLIRLLIAAPIKNIHFQNTKWKVKSFTALILLKDLYINQRSQLHKRSHYGCSCHVNMANSKTFLNISELLSKSQETSQKRGQEDSKRGCRRLLWNCFLHHMDLALKLTAAVLSFKSHAQDKSLMISSGVHQGLMWLHWTQRVYEQLVGIGEELTFSTVL